VKEFGQLTSQLLQLPKLLHLPHEAAGVEEERSPPAVSFPNCFTCRTRRQGSKTDRVFDVLASQTASPARQAGTGLAAKFERQTRLTGRSYNGFDASTAVGDMSSDQDYPVFHCLFLSGIDVYSPG
jgi:hypothetical protein